MATKPRATGSKSIPIKKIENESNLEVTFSKRPNGVYWKASQLGLLCHSPVAVVIISDDGKIHAFGDPSLDEILDGYIHGYPQRNSGGPQLIEANQDTMVSQGNANIVEYKEKFEYEKNREETIDEMLGDDGDKDCLDKWWGRPVQELTLAQTDDLLLKLEEFKHPVSCGDTCSSTPTNEDVGGATSYSNKHGDKGKASMLE